MFTSHYGLTCVDHFGNTISVNDYVIALNGDIEGYVTNIIFSEYGTFLEISTPGGRVITNKAYPNNYYLRGT